jgi:hypothetical protein
MTEQARETPEPLTPATEAGKALLASLHAAAPVHVPLARDAAAIVAIEHEAESALLRVMRAAEKAALRAATPDPAEPGLDVDALGDAISKHAAAHHWCGIRCGPDVARIYAEQRATTEGQS